MENQKQEEENIRNPNSNLASDSGIDIEKDIENEHPNENQLPGTTRKNLGLVETLKKSNVSRTSRDELILKIDRDFYDDLSAKTISTAVQLDKGEDKNSKNSQDEKHDMEMEMDGEEESPISKALRNPIVIKNIIGFLSWSSILTSRLVNKMWLTLCNVSLSKARADNHMTDVICIRFRYCDETGAFIKDFNGLLRGEIKTLEGFNDYLTQLGDGEGGRSGFPCKNFEFKNLVLNSCQIQRFFKIQGAEIRGLRLDFCRMDSLRSVNAESLTDLLMNSCPNVECLYILKIPDHMQRNEEENPNPNPNPAHILNININSVNENQVGDAISKLPRFSLTRLKCLLIYTFYAEKEYKMLVRDIALSSPALQHVDVRDLFVSNNLTSSFDYLTSTSKSHLVRRVTARPERKNLDILKRFAHFRPRLGYLRLFLDLVDCGTAQPERSISLEQFLPLASALLDSSKESLERLYMFGARGGQVGKLLKDGGISTLKNVRCVGLTCKESSTHAKGQTRLGTRTRRRWTNPLPVASFNRIFPNAVELVIDGEMETTGLIVNTDTPLLNDVNASANANANGDGDGEMSGRNETETQVIPQITRLSVYYAFPKDLWLNLPSLFCNVQQLFVENDNLLPVLPLIWQLGKTDSGWRLKKLELKMRLKITGVPLDQLSPAFIFPGLDAAITGFPEEACLELLSMYPSILDQEMVQEIRINSSILDLKHLQELSIIFWIPPNEELPLNVLTVVSGAYAFGRMRMRMKQEQERVKVFIKTELWPGDDQTTAATSAVIAKNQRIENILKPLKSFADIEFTIN